MPLISMHTRQPVEVEKGGLSLILLAGRFKNRPPLGFEELQGEADQTLELSSESSRVVEYPVK